MTVKKESEISQSNEIAKKPSLVVEGADELFEEALAAIEKVAKSAQPDELEKVDDEITVQKSSIEEGLSEELEDKTTSMQAPPVTPPAELVDLWEQLDSLRVEKEKFEAEHKKLYEQLLRNTAEFDNFRKRTQREKEELKRYGNEDCVRDLLDVVDNFERALETFGDAPESIREGITMVHRLLIDILSRYGVNVFDSQGEPFDYARHQAISVFETDEIPPQMVYEEFKKGYTFYERLLRPAVVIVSKPLKVVEEATVEEAKEEFVPEQSMMDDGQTTMDDLDQTGAVDEDSSKSPLDS